MASAKTRRSDTSNGWREPKLLYDEDAERSVLGAVLGDPAMHPRLAPLLCAGDFYLRAHRAIWEAVVAIGAEGGIPDELAVIAWLERCSRLAEAGGMETIAPLTTGVPPSYSHAVTGWARILLEHAERRAQYDLGCAYVQVSQYPLDAAPRAEIARQQQRLDDIQGRLRGEGHMASRGKLLRFVNMAEVEAESIRWLWTGRLALGKLTMMDGDPGLGKSLVTVDLAARVAMGRSMPDGSAGLGEPANVVLVSGEDSYADTVAPRLLAAGVSPEAMWRIQGLDQVEETRSDGTTSEWLFSLVTDLPKLEETIRKIGVRLLIIDPITAYLGSGTDMYKDADLRRVLTPLAKMAERTGVAVVLVRHLNKSTSTPALHRGLGGVGFIGVARLGLLVAPNPDAEGEVLVSRHKGNIGAPPPTLAYRIVQVGEAENMPRLQWLGERATTAEDGLAAQAGAGADRETRSATDEAVEWLRSYLANGPRPAKAIVEDAIAAGIIPDKHHDKPLRTARMRICKKPEKDGMHGGWIWELDPEKAPSSSGKGIFDEVDNDNPDFKPVPTKMPTPEDGGHLHAETPPKMPSTDSDGHLQDDAEFNGSSDVPEHPHSPKMPFQREQGIFERDHDVCRVTGGSHSYYVQRTFDGRRVCIECDKPDEAIGT